MKKMSSTEIRNMWYQFFEQKGHKKMASAPLIPKNDKSLLWINAGVAPLKKYFDGREVPENRRIVSVQKCIRTNDIENVGMTTRHQTFFEMMGNFSVGDYFKEEAIGFAFELLTSEEWFAIPKDKLYFTVYTEDQDAYEKWLSLGIQPDHIVKLDGKDSRKKIERWQKIAEVAAKQSGRNVIPSIEDVIEIKRVKECIKEFDLFLVAYEEEKNVILKQELKKIKQKYLENNALKIGILIGPEGGLEKEEVESLKQSGAKVITLGNRILRTETAPIAVLSNIMYEYDE